MAAHLVLPWIHQMVLQPQGLGPWGLSQAAQEIPANLSRRVRLPLQTDAERGTPPSAPCFAIAIRAKPVTYNMLVAPEQSA